MQVIFLFIQVFQSRATILLTLFVVVNTCFSQGVSNKLEVSDSSGYVAPPASKKDTLTYFHNGQGYPSKAQSPFFSYTSPYVKIIENSLHITLLYHFFEGLTRI